MRKWIVQTLDVEGDSWITWDSFSTRHCARECARDLRKADYKVRILDGVGSEAEANR